MERKDFEQIIFKEIDFKFADSQYFCFRFRWRSICRFITSIFILLFGQFNCFTSHLIMILGDLIFYHRFIDMNNLH